jgi:hypothetical protein
MLQISTLRGIIGPQNTLQNSPGAVMKIFNFAPAVLLVALQAAPAFARAPAFNEVERCRISEDPFAIPAYIYGIFPGEGRNGPGISNPFHPSDVGHCVDQKDYRPVLTLTPDEIIQYNLLQDSNRISVGNVRALDGWYTASIPFNAASHANFLVAIHNMPVLGVRGGHAELRVFFSEPVILTPQWPANPENRVETDELIFTANPTGFDGPSRHDPVKNFDGSLLNARGIHTREIRIKQSFIDHHTYTEHQYRLNLEPEELSDYIKLYIERATQSRLSQRFILATRNCDSTQFEILDSVLTHRYKMFQLPFDPEFAKKRLEERKIIAAEGEVIPLEEEPFAKDMFAKFGRAKEK